jgi:iron complex transport system substrate-binding protein
MVNRAAIVFVARMFLWLAPILATGELPAQKTGSTERAAPRRLISLAPGVTEILFELGLGDRLVGVTTYCDYPAQALSLPKIGGYTTPNIEALIAKKPDLVIGVADIIEPSKIAEMRRLGLKVTLIRAADLADILASIRTIGRLTGREDPAERLVARINSRIQEVKQKVSRVPRRAVLLVVGRRPLVAAGKKNFIDELITLAGGENIAGQVSRPWVNLPDEYVVARAPEVIIEAGVGPDREGALRQWQDLKSLPAIKEGRVYSYPSEKIIRPGPRIGGAAAELARLIHPECFDDSDFRESRC